MSTYKDTPFAQIADMIYSSKGIIDAFNKNCDESDRKKDLRLVIFKDNTFTVMTGNEMEKFDNVAVWFPALDVAAEISEAKRKAYN